MLKPITVPPSIHEAMVLHFAEVNRNTGKPVQSAEFTEMADAVKIARDEAEALANLGNALRADRSKPVEEQLVRTSSAAVKAAERVAAKLDVARNKTTTALAAIDRTTGAPPPPANQLATQLEAETRAALRSMTDKERQELVGAAFAQKDLATIGAVLRGAPFLAGVTKAQQDIWRARYAKEFHPAEYARRERLSKALEATDRAGDVFRSFVTDLTNTEAARIAAANAARADAALAAVNERGAA